MSGLSNYPPGCTGNEYEIAGADHEWEEHRHCGVCERTTPHSCASYRNEAWGDCDVCGTHIDIDLQDRS